jgi:oxygen-independent coproporphyrinogen-3 oxidase
MTRAPIVDAIPVSVYIHWPWCIQKCPYCDFNSHVKRDSDEQAYAEALLQDWTMQLPLLRGRRVSSIFFGGGTPSLASPKVIASLIARIEHDAGLTENCEITLEANPGTVDSEHFSGYRSAGVNRLSLGVQSFDSALLAKIGRIHDGHQAKRAIELARRIGFDNVNLDLMVGLPGQSEDLALADIELALAFHPEHLSHYQLTLEPNTPFFARPPKDLPDADAADVLQNLCHQRLLEAGFDRYEVSAWRAQKRFASVHNLNYWQFGDYIGLGAGAHGKHTGADGRIFRTEHAKSPARYVDSIQQAQGALLRGVALSALPFEFLMNALRLREGVAVDLFAARTGLPLQTLAANWQLLQDKDLLVSMAQGRLVTTELGYRYLNTVLSTFLSE